MPAARQASLAEIARFVAERRLAVLSFVGYSAAGYEDPDAMRACAEAVLARHDPARTLVNIGGTAVGIGEVYELAKRRGFGTMGIVSTLARDEAVPLSPCVDEVFFVADRSWGGWLEGTHELSPTSAAIVAVSDSMVGIGGGAMAGAELLAARRAGKPVQFFAADMDHRTARDKAAQAGAPPPDFGGEARALLDPQQR